LFLLLRFPTSACLAVKRGDSLPIRCIAPMRILHGSGFLPHHLVSLSAEHPQDIGKPTAISTHSKEFPDAKDKWQ
jgi:hypothetical protein